MIGWLPIPHAALAAAGRDGRLAVLDLYERAHLTGYGPIGFTDRELADEWGLGRKAVWSVLDRLERAGLITVERAEPGSRRASSVTVQRPVGEGRRHMEPIPEPVPEPEQMRENRQNGPAGATPGATHGASPEPARAELFPGAKTRADETRAEEQQTVVDAPLEDARTVLDAVPRWARGHKGAPPLTVLGSVVRALEAIRQRQIDHERCANDAKHVLALQKATGTPWEELADSIALVARWAQESHDGQAVNDIRGIRPDGETWGPDRSRAVATICVHKRWDDRLDAARRWEARGCTDEPRPRGPPAQARRGQSTAGDGVLDEVLRRARAQEQGHGDDDRGSSVLAGDRGGWDPEALVDR